MFVYVCAHGFLITQIGVYGLFLTSFSILGDPLLAMLVDHMGCHGLNLGGRIQVK